MSSVLSYLYAVIANVTQSRPRSVGATSEAAKCSKNASKKHPYYSSSQVLRLHVVSGREKKRNVAAYGSEHERPITDAAVLYLRLLIYLLFILLVAHSVKDNRQSFIT